MSYRWQLDAPVNAIVFDCDGTLSDIEGIDELARTTGQYDEVSAITTHCMSTTGLSEESYEQRLDLIKPTKSQVEQLVKKYRDNITPGTKSVINALQELDKRIYIISSGIADAVIPFGNYLGIRTEHIFAVNLQFDKNGHYVDFDRKNPLVHSGGKLTVIKKIMLERANLALIGDGMSDYEASKPVKRFIGYGGMAIREKIKSLSEFYISCHDLHPVLPLCLTKNESDHLDSDVRTTYDKGIHLISKGNVSIQKG